MSTSIYHEISRTTGQHRIIIVREGIPKVGLWAEAYQVAVHGKYRAVVQGGALPAGVFTTPSAVYENIEA